MTTTVVNIRDRRVETCVVGTDVRIGSWWYRLHDVVRIDRTGPYGNPFRVTEGQTREQAIERYRDMVMRALADAPSLLETFFGPLRGKRLGCWCAPLPCHGDVIVEILGWPRFLPQNQPALEAYWSDYQRIRDRGDVP